MADVVTLRPADEPAPVAAVVTLLREALAMAEAGDLIGVAILGCHRGRCDSSAYALGEGSIGTLVLAGRRLEARLLAHGEEG